VNWLFFALGMSVGIILTAWVLWGIYTAEREELRRIMVVELGYENLKKMMRSQK
jgi:ABC-type cobalamin transport system permease subunit